MYKFRLENSQMLVVAKIHGDRIKQWLSVENDELKQKEMKLLFCDVFVLFSFVWFLKADNSECSQTIS